MSGAGIVYVQGEADHRKLGVLAARPTFLLVPAAESARRNIRGGRDLK